MAAMEPVAPGLLAQLVELPVAQIESLCVRAHRPVRDARAAASRSPASPGGYRFQTHPELAPYVERFVLEGQHARLSGPALETLAIIAYKQPLSRGQIAAIRGVDVESVLRTLLQRGYVEEVGRDPGPGNAVLYGTTRRVPRTPRARLAGRPAAARRLRARVGRSSNRSSGACASPIEPPAPADSAPRG